MLKYKISNNLKHSFLLQIKFVLKLERETINVREFKYVYCLYQRLILFLIQQNIRNETTNYVVKHTNQYNLPEEIFIYNTTKSR